MHHLTAFAGLLVMPTHTWTEALALLLRWVHFLAGITWIGLLYFFNLVHVLSIGIGGGFGIIMLMNVWGIIWRNNKRIIQGTLAGSPPANAAVLARQAFLASRTNFFLSVPMLFFMAASSHYTILGG